MSIPYFYQDLTGNNLLDEGNFHYALHVLRMREGDRLQLTDGRGKIHHAVIAGITKKHCGFEILETIVTPAPALNLHLAIAFTRNPARMEWLLEKATEIGIQEITPLVTARSGKLHFKRERFHKILVSAMLQSQQSHLPVLHEARPVVDVIQENYGQKLFGYCGDEVEKRPVREVIKSGTDCLFLIGPEGDFTLDEVHLCLQHQCTAVTLGSTRLRTETAGLYACTLFNFIQ